MTETSRSDLLIELGCEELPPLALPTLARAFFDGVCSGLAEAGMDFTADESSFHYTPRRMAVRMAAVANRQPDRVQDKRGPALAAAFDASGQPTPAAAGFARSVGKSVEELETRTTDKGEWLFCQVEIQGQSLAELVFPILKKALNDLPVPRPMRWSDHSFSFVRPVHWLVVLHGEAVLDGELYGCRSGRLTRGHRIHAPGPHKVSDAGGWLQVMNSAFVEADQAVRKQKIRAMAADAGRECGGHTRITDQLLEEVCNLVEWPVAVTCRFEEIYLDVPQEALVTAMETHQKFFPVLEAEKGRLSCNFVVIANIESRDLDAVREGFERVVRPRLADARFFWERDLRTALADNLAVLDKVIFQKDLGTIGDKSRRISALSKKLEDVLDEQDSGAGRAALLSKCDLTSHMVGEFPSLQGTMGAYYAAAAGEPEEVVKGIGSHYRPRFAGDAIPQDMAGRIVSLSDRMDTLVGIFAAGIKPTGNKDPFALRRAALGVIRILLESGFELSFESLIDGAAEQLSESIPVPPDVREVVQQFMIERLRHFLSENGASARQLNAVLAAPLVSVPDLASRLQAVADFMSRPESESLVAANKRIGNILAKSEDAVSAEINEDIFVFDQERVLFDEINRLRADLETLFNAGEYGPALSELSLLKGPVDDYFDEVLVMAEDDSVRRNRLSQLAALKSLFDRVADFSQAT